MARKITPEGGRGDGGGTHDRHRGQHGRWREPQVRPTRAPDGEVRWWERPPPEDSDPRLWEAVQRIQARRQQLGMSVTELARRASRGQFTIARETLSRVLNGKQPTTWATAERLADVVGIDLDDDSDGPGALPPSSHVWMLTSGAVAATVLSWSGSTALAW